MRISGTEKYRIGIAISLCVSLAVSNILFSLFWRQRSVYQSSDILTLHMSEIREGPFFNGWPVEMLSWSRTRTRGPAGGIPQVVDAAVWYPAGILINCLTIAFFAIPVPLVIALGTFDLRIKPQFGIASIVIMTAVLAGFTRYYISLPEGYPLLFFLWLFVNGVMSLAATVVLVLKLLSYRKQL